MKSIPRQTRDRPSLRQAVGAARRDRAALLVAYLGALEPYRDVFWTGRDMGTFPTDFLDGSEDPVPPWAQGHEGLGMDDLATGHGVKAAADAALARLGRTLEGATVAIEEFGKVGAGDGACVRSGGGATSDSMSFEALRCWAPAI